MIDYIAALGYARPPGGGHLGKTYVNMCVRKDLKCTHISEVDDQRITPISEPFSEKQTLRELSFFTGRGGRLSEYFLPRVKGGARKFDNPRSQTGAPPLPVKNDSSLKP